MPLEIVGEGLEHQLPIGLGAEGDTGPQLAVDWSWQYLEGTIAAEAGVSGPAVLVPDSADSAPFDSTYGSG